METSTHQLSGLYRRAHDSMRNIDGLQPQEAFDELLKFLFFKQANEELGPPLSVDSSLWVNGLLRDAGEQAANQIKDLFSKYVSGFNSWFKELWKDKSFHLSDAALISIYQLFSSITFASISFDVRSAALREFMTPDIRRGLGIYLTPDDVVKMMVDYVAPRIEDSVYDPACGSGTFLIETLRFRGTLNNDGASENKVWGTDKNPRMLILAELNIGHLSNIKFDRYVTDALFPEKNNKYNWPSSNTFDVIFTNPPFGVVLDSVAYDLRHFQTCRAGDGKLVGRQQSEIIFVEQALKYLKPGGTLAIVLPKSAITNSRLHVARQALDKLGYIYSAVILPPETFASTGTQASTVVLFIRKYDIGESSDTSTSIAVANVTNVGYDATGRVKDKNQLPLVANELRSCIESDTSAGFCTLLKNIPKGQTFSELSNLLSRGNPLTTTLRMGDVVEAVLNGRTPPRSHYSDKGMFVVKVGNLTGNGISWLSRERNFVIKQDANNRLKNPKLILQQGDILLTSAAHNSTYIAKKADIIDAIPEWVGGVSSFVGEVMMIRPNQKVIDPFILLAYLRLPSTTQAIQRLVRGQTAHLYPADVMELPLPPLLLEPDENLQQAATILRVEVELNRKVNDCAFQQQQLLSLLSLEL